MNLRLHTLAATVLAGLVFVASAAAEEARPQEPQEMLVGLVLDGREVQVVDAYWDGNEFLIPAESFFALCRCRHEDSVGGEIRVETPLGAATLPPHAFTERNGVRMLREHALDAVLAVRLSYEPARFALVIDLPWTGEAAPPSAAEMLLAPDVRPPSASLSSAIFRLQHAREGEIGASGGSMILSGRAAGGSWRLRYEDHFGGSAGIAEYGWMRRFDDRMLLLGHQRINAHPLLGSLEMTGVQTAWTNQPLDLFVMDPEPTELLPRQLRSATTVRGTGVAAGTAVLRVEDRPVASQVMGLDGRYEFREVPLPSAGRQRIEVLIYDRHDPTVPVDIQDHSRSAARNLLPGGAVVMQGGVGRTGNLATGSTPGAGAAAFYQTRVGVAEGFTVEAAYQRAGGRSGVALGATGQIGSGLVATVGGALESGRQSYLADVAGDFGAWRLTARSQANSAGTDLLSAARAHHFMEISRRGLGGALEVGVVAQVRRGYGEDSDFVLPWAYWRPHSRLLMRARPDGEGRYRLDGSWAPAGGWRVGLSRSGERTIADVGLRLDGTWRASLVGERTDAGAHREAALLTWSGKGSRAASISGGPLISNGRPGVLLSAQAPLVPGVLIGARYETSAPLDRPDRARDHRLALVLTGNLSFAGTRILPGSYGGLNGMTGSLGGRLRVVGDPYDLPADALEGVVVRIDGRPMTRTMRGGRFHIAQLPPGVYRVDFDPGKLPLELTPARGELRVKVEAGAVTRADLWLEVEFGIAGRVRVAGEAAPDLAVELVDERGDLAATGTTDRFGLYRFDGIARGIYHLRVAGAAVPTEGRATRRVVVRDDFLFDQDLSLERTPLR